MANRAPDKSDACPHCGLRYGAFMPGTWGNDGTKLNPSSAKRHAWAEHTANCGRPVYRMGPVKASQPVAVDFLESQLQLGPAPASEIQDAALSMGISLRTLHRAKKTLGVISQRFSDGNTGAGQWHWSLDDCPF